MDFARLVGGQDAALTRQLAENLLSNTTFRNAAIKAVAQTDESTNQDAADASAEAPSALDSLLDQLTSALSQPPAADAPDAPDQHNGVGIENLLNHPLVQQALTNVPAEQALAVKVALGQIPPEMAERAFNLMNSVPASTVNKVGAVLKNLSNEDLERGITFFQALFNHEKMAFTQQSNGDAFLNSQNAQLLSGADLNKFLQTAYYVAISGYDIGKFLDNATNVLNKGDYDDFSRFLSVTDMALYKNEDMDAFFDFGNQLLETSPQDYEGNLFQAYTVMAHGGRVTDYIDIANNLKVTGAGGRNNIVDLTRITIDFKNAGGYTPALFNMLATEAREGGNVRALMDEYMADRGMAHSGPDFERFDRVERIDSSPMVIKQGENAALFAQALSSASGLLPESVLAWSSKETGALAQGTSHLDLSTLPPGTYHIAVKIVGYAGTDTALKTVIVEPADGSVTVDGETDEPETPVNTEAQIEIPISGKVKISVPDQAPGAAVPGELKIRVNNDDEASAGQATPGMNSGLERMFQQGDKLTFTMKSGEELVVAMVTQLSEAAWELTFGEGEDAITVIVTLEPQRAGDGDDAGDGGPGGVADGGGTVSPGDDAPAQPAVEPLTRQEAMDLTRSAISSLNAGASASSVVASLNERYYAALDQQIASNQSYAQRVDEVRNDAAKLKTLLQQLFRELRNGSGYNPYV
ncbi:MAG: hypothetical protein IGS03_12930 [Candidatus Sericytochromatia bacterium]|nr:hypothetical protein [Candidatus Sericytochromatia bacterium]